MVEAAGVEDKQDVETLKLLIPGTAKTAKKARKAVDLPGFCHERPRLGQNVG
jgi:hypothetical protein